MSVFTAIGVAADFLHHFGYLPDPSASGQALADAVAAFQATYGMEPTGQVDGKTARAMEAPRCGLSDAMFARTSIIKWNKKHLKWHLSQRVDEPEAAQAQPAIIAQCCDDWSAVCGVTFEQVDTTNEADIVVVAGKGRQMQFDGPGNTLAWAELPVSQQQLTIAYDIDETWIVDPKRRGILLRNVTCHEWGHLLGLDHTQVPGSLMNPYYNTAIAVPQPDDISQGVRRYGGPAAPQPKPPATPSSSYILRVEGKLSIDGHRISKLG